MASSVSSAKTKPGRRTATGSKLNSRGERDLIINRGLEELLKREQDKTSTTAATARRSANGGLKNTTGPNFVGCYLCGRQFGQSSLKIHRSQCYLKMMIAWERAESGLRGPKPVDPETHERQVKAMIEQRKATGLGEFPNGTAASRRVELEMYNQAQSDAYNTRALAPCPNCGRTFIPDRLQVHLRSCKPGSSSKSVQSRRTRTTAGTAAGLNTRNHAEEVPTSVTEVSTMPDYDSRNTGADEQPTTTSEVNAIPENAGMGILPAGGTVAVRGKSPSVAVPDAESSQLPAMPTIRGREVTSERTTPLHKTKSPSYRSSHSQAKHCPYWIPTKSQAADLDREADVTHAQDVVFEIEAKERQQSGPTVAAEDEGDAFSQRPSLMEGIRSCSNTPSGNVGCIHDNMVTGNGSVERAGTTTQQDAPSMPIADVNAMTTASAPGTDVNGHTARSNTQRAGGGGAIRENSPSTAAVQTEGVLKVIDAQNDGSCGFGAGSDKKIKLNNVSRFKNVQSRVLVEEKKSCVELVPCHHCGRTFNPQRVARHEECCIERNAPPSTTRATPRTGVNFRPSTAKKAVAPNVQQVSNPSIEATDPGGMTQFCGTCGVKMASTQNFCKACGTKV